MMCKWVGLSLYFVLVFSGLKATVHPLISAMADKARGPPPKPAKRKPREVPLAPSPDKPPPRPGSKDRTKPASAAAIQASPASQQNLNSASQQNDESKFQPLDLGREHEGIPHGWSPAYWKYVTRPKKIERSRERLRNVTAYYRISKIYDIGFMICLLLLVICVILAGVFRP